MKRFALAVLFVSILLFTALAEVGFAQTPTSSQTATQDPQAVAMISQVLTSAGGLSALGAIQDFSGSGTITYNQPRGASGTVSLRGTRMEQFRLDATLSTGVRSEAMNNGLMTLRLEDGKVVPLQLQVPLCPGCVVLPYLLLAPALNNPGFSIWDKGMAEVDGRSLHKVEVQVFVAGLKDQDRNFREYHTLDFFIDPSTFQIYMMEDLVPKHLVRQIRFSDYQNVKGTLVPFSISEQSGGLPTWTIQLTQISFNAGLQDSDFQF